MRSRAAIAALLLTFAATPSAAGTVHAAVAANFTAVAEEIGAAFEAATGHEMVFSFGATGTLYAQISQAAPFDVFLAADAERTKDAIAAGLAVEGSEFTYAEGRVVLFSPSIDLADGVAVLAAGDFHHIAVADPRTAPYGAAALAVLDGLGLRDTLAPRIVTGENITQALQFVLSGSAELGFVALSQVTDRPAGAVWLVPNTLHPPIRQNAVLLTSGANNEAAGAFLDYLRSPPAIAMIEGAGYGVD